MRGKTTAYLFVCLFIRLFVYVFVTKKVMYLFVKRISVVLIGRKSMQRLVLVGPGKTAKMCWVTVKCENANHTILKIFWCQELLCSDNL